MRNLAQPRVLKLAGAASLVTTLACYPRLPLWLNRSAPIWYLEAVLFFCGMVLWGFVFAWHTRYTQRPVFTFKPGCVPFVTASLAGIAVAAAFHLFLDPALRPKMPEDYPSGPRQWLAMTLFYMAFNQLFLIFAPFAWLIRLFQKKWAATGLTVLFGVIVMAIKIRSNPAPFSPLLFAALLAGRLVMGFLAVTFYLRGGVLLSWWWTLLIESRNLLAVAGNP